MSYVDAIYNKEKDLIHIVERIDGVRKYRDYPAKDRKSTRLNSSHSQQSRMPSSA